MQRRNIGRRESDRNAIESLHRLTKTVGEFDKMAQRLYGFGMVLGFLVPYAIRYNWPDLLIQSEKMGTQDLIGTTIVPGNISLIAMLIAGAFIGFGVLGTPGLIRRIGVYNHAIFAASISSIFAWIYIIGSANNSLASGQAVLMGIFFIGAPVALLVNHQGKTSPKSHATARCPR